ncbi:hypothetical protein A3218_01925 [Pseudomonas chlororaphis]|uniref:hypothetical protein n=1 Tax=Pseudomonas chlororaphis TaxID=587753 RepID=UPI000789F743|nr:hypothetical protein [Pseudomonas chlororaphis]AMS13132.1 hypothetical protein A3218_01925 [Pseudomonas chlororaphis]
MRKLRSHEVIGLSVDEILKEFNERASEFGVTEENLVSVSVNPPRHAIKILDGDKTKEAKVQITFIYWSDR